MHIIEIPNQKKAILVLEKINYEVQGHQNILNEANIGDLGLRALGLDMIEKVQQAWAEPLPVI